MSSFGHSSYRYNQLWGLIACHNKTPKFVTLGVRIACKLFAKILNLELANIVENRDFKYKLSLHKTAKDLLELIAKLEYSRLGRANFSYQEVDLNAVIE
ncbi:hypothetical protein [Crocosphaera sp.]|uniref:hypothetical protein n=1 Tax=Crocosphaera sp. TaxID=2729996 RepID=UPI003F22BBAE|nr:hypothetical protein [Crocosphaera sp.]